MVHAPRWGTPLAFMLTSLSLPFGCGTDGIPLAPVSGRVTVDGEPIVGLRVSFEPIGGPGRPLPGPDSIAITDEEGRYSVSTTDAQRRGAVVGPSRVRIWAPPPDTPELIVDDRDPDYDPIAEIKALKMQMRGGKAKAKAKRATRLIPLRFNDKTTLTFDVPPGGTDRADFAIASK